MLAVCDSYIHPDEHFQSFQPLCRLLLHFDVPLTWEFTSSDPVRSYAPLLAFYWPVMAISRFFHLSIIQTWYLARLQIMVCSWVAVDWCLYKMLPIKQERIKTIFFFSTSYACLVYQSHLFSNSLETILVVMGVYIVNELRFLTPHKDVGREVYRLGVALGVVTALGIFNRPTYPAIFILPAVFYVQCLLTWKLLPVFTAISFVLTVATCMATDTAVYKNLSLHDLWDMARTSQWHLFVVTPLNNLAYNSQASNLALHGTHPYFTHIAVNIPQLLGPGILFLDLKYWKTTPFLAAVGAVGTLSLVPHQEARFLVPVIPLLCCCFEVKRRKCWGKSVDSLLFYSWLLFNFAMALLMGILHQGGVVPALQHLHDLQMENASFFWWRTYSPPTWMLGDGAHPTQFYTVSDGKISATVPASGAGRENYDLMGTDPVRVQALLEQSPAPAYLVAPVASFERHFEVSKYEREWTYFSHVDLDHLDEGLTPGLAIYRLL